jgi:hypothetical protein
MATARTFVQSEVEDPLSSRRRNLPHTSQAWHIAYMAALFEADRSQMNFRIKEAERLILRREREVLADRSMVTERSALNNALHALHALRSCLGLSES